MEQQNKLTEEEKAYQALRTQDMQDMPDLWSRIDTGFEEEVTKQQAARKKRRTRQFVLVAAAILIVIIAVPVGISSMRKSNMKEMKTETAADMHVTEAGKDEMADEADSALPNIADQTVQADSEIQESADASVNHMDGNGATEAQTDAAIAANQSGNQASEECNDGNNQMSYQTITQVILTQYDAQGKIVQQFDSEDTDGAIDKVQFLLETYQVLDWKPVDMIKSDMPLKSVISLYIENGVMREKLVYASEHDGLTGLYNKAKYLEMAEKEFQSLDSIAIFNFDVNNLKKMNDQFGHEAGDKLIIKAANSFRKVTSNRVHAFRMGGDEFLLVAENISKTETDKIRQRWEEELARLNMADDGIDCVVAVGVAYGEKEWRSAAYPSGNPDRFRSGWGCVYSG